MNLPSLSVRTVCLAALLAVASLGHAATLRPFDSGSLAAILKAHSGHALVVAFWSIHCAPCLEDMEDWRALQAAHRDVPVILVTTDGPAEQVQVQRILERYRMDDLQSWAFADEFSERVRYAVDRTWRGELPRTYFYDRGHKVQARTGRLDRKWSEDWFRQQE